VVLTDVAQADKGGNSLFDLVQLDGSVHQDGNVVGADANHLNGVFLVQGVVNEYELVDEAEDKEGEVARDGASDTPSHVGIWCESHLELSEDIAACTVSH